MMATSTLPATSLRLARRYAPHAVTELLHDIAGAPRLGLVLDLDAIERTTSVSIDRVMLLALDGLSQAKVDVLFAASATRDRAQRIRRSLWPAPALVETGATGIADARRALVDAPLVVLSDDPNAIAAMTADDRGLWIGHPHGGVMLRVCTIGPTAIRASLWCLLHERTHALRQRA